MTRHTLRFSWLFAAALAATLGSATPCLGQTSFTGTYSFAGSTGSTTSLAFNGTPILNLTVGNLTKNGVNNSSSSNNFRANNWTQGATIDLTDYFEFTLTADATYLLDMTSITFGIGRSATGPVNWEWRTSTDTYGSTVNTYTNVNAGLTNNGGVLTNPDLDSSWTGNILDLSGSSYESVSSITFRFCGYASEGSTGSGGFQGPLSFAGALIGPGTYWSPGAGGGGTGTWSSASTVWATTSGTQGKGLQAAGGGLVFGNTAGTVTVSDAVTAAAGITIGTTGYQFTSGTISLTGANAAANTITADTGVSATISSVLAGSNGMTKSGAGTVTLSGTSSLTGGTTISGGLLRVTGALTSSPITVSSGGSLGGSGSVGSVTIGSGGRIAPGTSPGTLTTGDVVWEGGGFYDWELYDAAGAAGTGYDTISSSGSLTINATSGNTFTINLLTLSGTNPDTAGPALNFSPATSGTWTLGTFATGISGFATDRLTINDDGFQNAFGGTFSLAAGATALNLVYTAPETVNYTYTGGSGDWSTAGSWTGSLTPSGTATITFSGTGGTATNDIAAGTLPLVKGITFADGAGAYTVAGPIPLGLLGVVNNSAATQTLSGTLTLAAGTLIDAVAGPITVSGEIATAGNALIVEGGFATSFATISGTGGFTKSESGTATLTGTVGSASVTLTAGRLVVDGANLLADTAAVTISGGTLDLGSFTDTVGYLTIAGGTLAGSSASLTATTYALNGGAVAAGVALGSGSLAVGGNAALAGTSGATTVNLNAGTLTLGSANRFTAANGPAVNGSLEASLVLGGNESLGSLAGEAGVDIGAHALTVGGLDTSTTYSGAITGAGSLTKTGTGTLTLSGANSYAGGTTISAGGLVGTTTSLQGTIANGGALTFTQESNGTYAGTLAGTGGLTKNGAGAVTLTGNNSAFSGTTTISAGTLVIGNAAALGSGGVTLAGGVLSSDAANRTLANAVTITANSGLAAASSGTLTLSSAVNLGSGTRTLTVGSGATAVLAGGYGTGGIAKAGAGTLVLDSNGSLTGLSISSGTLAIPAGRTVTTTASQLAATGGTLAIDGTLLSTASAGWTSPTSPVTVGATGTVIQQGNASGVANFATDSDVTWTAGSTFIYRDYTNSPSVANQTYKMNLVFDGSGGSVAVGAISGATPWTVQGNLTIGENVGFNFGSFSGALDFQRNVIVGGTLGATNAARSFTINSGRELLLQNAGALAIASDQTVTISGSVRSTATAAQTARISGGTLSLGGGTRTFDVAAGTGNAILEIASVIADGGTTAGGLTKTGAGTLRLTNLSTFTGPTSIEAGTLQFGADASLASTLIIVKSQAFLDARAKADEALQLTDGQTLQSGGTIQGDLVVGTGAVLAPGASTGQTTTTGNATFGPGGSFQFEINDATGSAGSTTNGWDLLVTDSLTITATVQNPYEIDIVSLTAGDPQLAGEIVNFNKNAEYEWRFVTASQEIQNFNASLFTFRTNNFQNEFWSDARRGFSVRLASYGVGVNNALVVSYTPEPEAWMLAGLGLAAGGWMVRRRKASRT